MNFYETTLSLVAVAASPPSSPPLFSHPLAWILFNIFVLLMLAIDLGVFNRKEHEVHIKEALVWSAVWISLALLFNLGLYFMSGKDPALKFFTGYLIEKSLSVDNLFVFIMVFSYFKVAPIHHHRVLYWGILAALIMRAVFIFAGVALINRFEWVIYVFGVFLVITGIRMAFQKEGEDPDKNLLLRISRRFIHQGEEKDESRFFVRKGWRLFPTRLFVVLMVINVADLIFATDSIPAILAITTDPFIVYTSNVFAILGLRALYFALAAIMNMFYYLHYGLAAILAFVGVKMLIADRYHMPVGAALAVIAVIMLICILASVVRQRKLSAGGKEPAGD